MASGFLDSDVDAVGTCGNQLQTWFCVGKLRAAVIVGSGRVGGSSWPTRTQNENLAKPAVMAPRPIRTTLRELTVVLFRSAGPGLLRTMNSNHLQSFSRDWPEVIDILTA